MALTKEEQIKLFIINNKLDKIKKYLSEEFEEKLDNRTLYKIDDKLDDILTIWEY